MKRELRSKRKAVRDEAEVEERSSSSLGLDEEGSSRSVSSRDRRRGEERSKKRQDRGHQWRARQEEEEKGKGSALEMGVSECIVWHRCAFELICALIRDLNEVQKAALRETVWGPVLDYKRMVMDRHLVETLIQVWNPEAKAFKIGSREVRFSYFDITLLTGLSATGKPVVFKRGKDAGEV